MTTLLSILFLGFFLGMRHATDTDHVIAVTTIVSRQRHIGEAALTGIFWGIGHSLTLLVVGGAIILFGLVIPERLGLSFEFCVALMLILLGALNLRSIKQGIQEAADVVTHRSSDATHLIRISTEITSMNIHTATSPENMVTPKAPCRPPASIGSLDGLVFTERSVRS